MLQPTSSSSGSTDIDCIRAPSSLQLEDSTPQSTFPLHNSTSALLEHETTTHQCALRNDTSGLWNILRTYYLFVGHLVACILFTLGMTSLLNGRNFRPGKPPSSILQNDGALYQTQVNGILSLALVLVRILAACCSAQIIWTTILILLDTTGITLQQISRMNNFRIPIIPRCRSRIQALWVGWAVSVVLLLWPPTFAAPVANASLAWNPLALDYGPPTQITLPIRTQDPFHDFWATQMPERQMFTYLESVVRAGASPAYAFGRSDIPLRRYFQRPTHMTENSTMDISLPYFEVNLRWIDASSDVRSRNITNTLYSDYVSSRDNGVSRSKGSVTVMMDEPWDRVHDYPKEATKLVEDRLFGVNIGAYGGLPFINGQKACPRTSDYFKDLPGLELQPRYYSNDNETYGMDCYQIGIATFHAGLYHAKECDVSLVGSTDAAATCYTTPDFARVDEDWAAPIATKMLSEVLKATIMLDNAKPWLESSIDNYTISALTLAYHAAWSSAVNYMTTKENSTYRSAAPMVQASVDTGKLLVWLCMNFTIILASSLVFLALRFSTVKFVRDTTITPLLLDLSEITHHSQSEGLCNAVALGKKDQNLPSLRFYRGGDGEGREQVQSISESCQRRLVVSRDNISSGH